MSATVENIQGKDATSGPRVGRRRLESLPMGARTTGAQAAARSLLIRRLRIGLPILAVVLIAAFILNTENNSVDQAFLEDFEDLSATAEELRATGPKFAGINDSGEPYEITSRAWLQRPNGPDVVELEMPRAIQGGKNTQSIVSANKGLYRQDANILELEDSVVFEHVVGGHTYTMRAPAATVAIEEEVVTSDKGVSGEGDDGSQLSAARMTAYRGEGRVVFEGGVSMRIYPNSTYPKAGDQSPETSTDAQEDEPR